MKISFCHPGNKTMASYRYQALIPSKHMGAALNDPLAEVLIFTKPCDEDIPWALKAKKEEQIIIVHFCDLHFSDPIYKEMLNLADAVTCPTKWFADYLRTDFGVDAFIVPDPFEFDEVAPHFDEKQLRCLWFGHGSNIDSLVRISSQLTGLPVRVVSNIEGTIPYSEETLLEVMAETDIVLMPETAPYKSSNRTVEAIRRGCVVIAEPHPALADFPIWKGNIKKGIEWAQQNPQQVLESIAKAQEYVKSKFSPAIQANAWNAAIQKARYSLMSVEAVSTGTDG